MKRLLLLIPLFCCASILSAAEYKTPNFTVNCDDAELAKKVGDSAEFHRSKHAKEWLGADIPRWYAPCPITVRYGNMGSGGGTTFSLGQGQVFDWDMQVQGDPQLIVDAVVPHEVLHMIFASHFRRKIPRWADEGAATSVELESEKKGWRATARQVVGTQEQIPIRTLLNMQEYPRDGRALAVLYAQGFYISEFLINKKGKQEFVKFLESYFKSNDWDTAFKKHYGYQNQEQAYTAAYNANKGQATPFDYDNYHIDVFVQDDCPPCKKWKDKDLPEVAKWANFKIRMVNLSESHNKERGKWDHITETPAFIIYKNEQKLKLVNGYRSWRELLDDCGLVDKYESTIAFSEIGSKSKSRTVKVAQGVGIGVFGRNPNDGSRPNPHKDLSPAQMQIINQAIDSRSLVNINNAIATRQGQLKEVIRAEIKIAMLEVQSKLTPEQKALINATTEQKALLESFKGQIEQVEAGVSEFQRKNSEEMAAVKAKDEKLAAEVETAKQERNGLRETIKLKVVEAVKSHIPDKLTGVASSIPGALQALSASGPIGLALYFGTRVLAARRKEDEPEDPKKGT